MEKIYKCPKCGEKENLHYNYDYNQQHRPIKDVLCNDCGEIFEGNMSVELFVTEANLTKPGFVERRMKQGKANNDKKIDTPRGRGAYRFARRRGLRLRAKTAGPGGVRTANQRHLVAFTHRRERYRVSADARRRSGEE